LTILDSRTSRVLFTALLFAVGLGFLYAARRTLILFLFAIFFAYLINPAVGRLEKLVRSRVWAITVIYLLLLLGLGVAGFLAGPRIARQSARLGESLPGLMDRATSGQLTAEIGKQHGWTTETQKRIQGFLTNHRDDIASLAQRIGFRAGAGRRPPRKPASATARTRSRRRRLRACAMPTSAGRWARCSSNCPSHCSC